MNDLTSGIMLSVGTCTLSAPVVSKNLMECGLMNQNDQCKENTMHLSDVTDVFVNLNDQNGNGILMGQSIPVTSSSPSKVRTVYSRKREASTSLPDDPKRKDQLRSEHNRRSDFCSAHGQHLSPTHNQNTNFLVAQNTVDRNYNSHQIENPSININGSGIPSIRTSCQGTEAENAIDIDAGCQTGSSSSFKDSSAASSTSDLSIHSSGGNSVGIQEDLDCLHLSDEASLAQSDVPKSPLVPSLFHKVPPTIYFSLVEEKVYPLPHDVCKLLKWKLSTITPLCIRACVERAGFQLVKAETTTDWVGTWGKHLKCAAFRTIQESQKVNHFPGSFHLGRKDKIWMIYSKMQVRHGDEEFSFFPETYVLPQDIRQLRQVWEKEGPQKRWIIKPPASARGTGIKVINRWTQIPRKRPVVVQRYLNDPYLINGAKFDLRIYVLVPSYEPLRMYMFDDGLVRFASERYSTSVLCLNDLFMHLTNYSINRKNSTYKVNDDENTCRGHKWSLKSLWKYLTSTDIDVKRIQEEILDLVIKTIICSEGPMTRLIKNHTKSRYNCFELFGFDIMLDKNLKPWLLEVNISPSLHTSSALDMKIKGQLAKDMLNLVGFKVPDKVLKSINLIDMMENFGLSPEEIQCMCLNKTLHHWYLSPEEKAKHSGFAYGREYEGKDILDDLTSDDVRHLIESEDELPRAGDFKRIFPTNSTSKYLTLFEHSRYYNVLFDAWELKYHNNRSEGIALLQDLCRNNFHLQTVFREPSFAVIKTSSS